MINFSTEETKGDIQLRIKQVLRKTGFYPSSI